MIKRLLLFFTTLILSYSAFAQHTVKFRNLWAEPQVHVLFDGYSISFTIKDINKSLLLLAGLGYNSFGDSSGLDSTGVYNIELYAGTRQQYRNDLQPLIQKGVGAFLLTAGHAVVKNRKHKKLKEILVDVGTAPIGEDEVVVKVYDPQNNILIFWGKMKTNMYNQDLGID